MNTNSKKLDGKVAVVTGASKGIGAAIAKKLAAEGAAVVINYSSSKTDGEKVAKEITALGGKEIAVQANMSKQEEIERLFAKSKKAFGRVDILVNNAGIYEFLPLEKITEEHFHKHFNVNVLGLLLASQAAARQFDGSGGSIINISSIVSTLAIPESGFTAQQKGRWTRSPVRWHPNLAPAEFASTRSDPAWWRRREPTRPALPKAIYASKSKRKHPFAGLASLRISPAPPFSSHPTNRRGSRVRHS
jgi:NAD(P)-dependent dehydrogenase (short-subunit alcohol dehydrogenase family)